MLYIWLDDIRPMPEKNFNVWCKTAQEAIDLIENEKVAYISFDHDLGFDNSKSEEWNRNNTGYAVAKKIEELTFANGDLDILWDIHSANPVGRKNIELAMKSAERFR